MKKIIQLIVILTSIGCKQDEIIEPSVKQINFNDFNLADELVLDSSVITSGYFSYVNGNGQYIDSVKTGEILNSGLELIIPKQKLNLGDGKIEFTLKGKSKNYGSNRLEFTLLKIPAFTQVQVSRYRKGLAKIEYFPMNSAMIDGDTSWNFNGFRKGVPIESLNKEVHIPYKKGNGQKYYGISTDSKLLLGLKAYTTTDVLANGDGILKVKLKGTPTESGVAYFDIGFGNYSTQFSIQIQN